MDCCARTVRPTIRTVGSEVQSGCSPVTGDRPTTEFEDNRRLYHKGRRDRSTVSKAASRYRSRRQIRSFCSVRFDAGFVDDVTFLHDVPNTDRNLESAT